MSDDFLRACISFVAIIDPVGNLLVFALLARGADRRATVMMALLSTGAAMATIALIAVMGVVAGLIMPSRDMLVRVVSPPDAVGRVFGIVTTGFNFGGMLGPVLGGWLVDHDMPRLIFFGSAAFMLATIAIAVFVPVPTS